MKHRLPKGEETPKAHDDSKAPSGFGRGAINRKKHSRKNKKRGMKGRG